MSSRCRRAASAYAGENGIARSYDSARRSCSADPAVDAVYISTTNELHRAQTLAAAKAGKHVLCEKPLALTLADARAMVAACRAAGVVMGTNHHLRNAATPPRDARGDRRRAHRQAAVRARLPRRLPAAAPAGLAHRPRPEAGGGVMLDITVHDADTLRFVLGDEPVEVVGDEPERAAWPTAGSRTASWACCRFRSGARSPSCTTRSPTHFAGTGFEVHGTEGSLVGPGCDDPAAGRRGRAAHRRRRGGAAGRAARTSTTARVRRFHARGRAARASRRRPARTASGRWRPASPCATRRPGRPGRRRSNRRSEPMTRVRRSHRCRGGGADPGRRHRHRHLVERPRLPRRGARRDRRALRRRRPPAQPDHAPPDRRRRHVRHQGHRPPRQARPARQACSPAPTRRGPSSCRAAGDLADDHRQPRSPPTTSRPASCSTCTARPRPSGRAC